MFFGSGDEEEDLMCTCNEAEKRWKEPEKDERSQ